MLLVNTLALAQAHLHDFEQVQKLKKGSLSRLFEDEINCQNQKAKADQVVEPEGFCLEEERAEDYEYNKRNYLLQYL